MEQHYTGLPQFKYASPVALAKWVTAAFVLYACADLYGIYFFITGVDVVRDLAAGASSGYYGYSDADLEAFVTDSEQVVAAILGFKLLVVIAWCMWTHRVASNTRAWDIPMSNTPGWAVGYYFIPILNLWKPYSALKEIWSASDPSHTGDDDPWLRHAASAPFYFLIWWLTYIGAGVVDRIGTVMLDDVDPSSWVSGMHWGAAALVIDLAAVGLALTVCWRLTQRQEERANAAMPRAEVVR